MFNRKKLIRIAGRILISLFAVLLLQSSGHTQSSAVTWFKDVQPIINKRCSPCHSPNNPGPFNLISYNDIASRTGFIIEVINNGYMPPWYADTSFSHFANENKITAKEIAIINAWVKTGKKQGKKDKKKKETVAVTLSKPDMVLSRKKPYTIPGDNKEHFKIFVIPSNTPKDRYVKSVQYIPGNKKLSHHSRIMIDTTNQLRPDDGIEVGASSEFEKQGIKMYDLFWKGWVPGNYSYSYPPGTGKLLPANADLIINTHYSPSPVEEKDDLKIEINFLQEPPERLIETFILDEKSISNPPFLIEENKTAKYYMRSPLLPFDISLISVLPHMHLLGKSIKVYAISPGGDVLPVINIPNWNFNWQMSYVFPSFLKLPKGSVVYAEALYDNTSANPRNPFSPPKPVTYGWGTNNEMFNVIFEYVPYKDGDEKIKLSSSGN
jgi:Copper type II ascorbate-dependent monooxygenase, C-terminal domain